MSKYCVTQPTKCVDEYRPEIDEFLAKVFRVRNAWVSDVSRVRDFFGVQGAPGWEQRAARHFGLHMDAKIGGAVRLVHVAQIIRDQKARR